MGNYKAKENRYDKMKYRRCGKSGINLPMISLGLWHNFGDVDDFENSRAILRTAFDNGITHFDLANNYGPPYGTAEKNFGKIFAEDFFKLFQFSFINKSSYFTGSNAMLKLAMGSFCLYGMRCPKGCLLVSDS